MMTRGTTAVATATALLLANEAALAAPRRARAPVPAKPPVAVAPAMTANSMICEPDGVSQRAVDADLANFTWVATLDPASNPLKVRLEAKGAKRLPLIDGPIGSSRQGAGGTWIVEGSLADPTPRAGLGGTMVRVDVWNYSLTVRDLKVESGTVGYRLGDSYLLTKFAFACHAPGAARKVSMFPMIANSVGGEG